MPERIDEIAHGIRIEWLSVVWLILESAVALTTGIGAHSVALTSFGADSIIELMSGLVLLWRLYVEAQGAKAARTRQAERTASWVVGFALICLAVYILLAAGRELITHESPSPTTWGLALALASGVFMPSLAAAKRRVGAAIGSPALRADAACSMVCAYMAWTVVAGVAFTSLFGWWWADGVASLLLVYFVFQEGWEAVEAAASGTHTHSHSR